MRPPAPPRALRVHVTTDVGQRVQYEAIFQSTCDAVCDAMERFTTAARIEVRPVVAAAGRRPSLCSLAATQGGDHAA